MVLIKQIQFYSVTVIMCVCCSGELTLIQRAKDFLREVTASRGLKVRTVLIAGSTRKEGREKKEAREGEGKREREREIEKLSRMTF